MDYKTPSIGFAPNLIPMIIDGTKTLTYRLGDKYNFLEPEDTLPFRNSETNKIMGILKINEKQWVKFKDLPIDRIGHEKYESKFHQQKIFNQYYNTFLKDSDDILILGFTLTRTENVPESKI